MSHDIWLQRYRDKYKSEFVTKAQFQFPVSVTSTGNFPVFASNLISWLFGMKRNRWMNSNWLSIQEAYLWKGPSRTWFKINSRFFRALDKNFLLKISGQKFQNIKKKIRKPKIPNKLIIFGTFTNFDKPPSWTPIFLYLELLQLQKVWWTNVSGQCSPCGGLCSPFWTARSFGSPWWKDGWK